MIAFQILPLLFLHTLKVIIKLINKSQIHSYCITLLVNRAILIIFVKKLIFCAEIIPICSETIKQLMFLNIFIQQSYESSKLTFLETCAIL